MEINHVSMANMKWFGCIAVNLNEGVHLEWNFSEENCLEFIKKYSTRPDHKGTEQKIPFFTSFLKFDFFL